jgi:hypothetical protein
MKRVHVAVALGAALPAAILCGLTVYLMGAPEWAPWLTFFVSYLVFALCFAIIVAELTESAPSARDPDDRPTWTALLSEHDDLDATRETDLRAVASHRAPRPRRAGVR